MRCGDVHIGQRRKFDSPNNSLIETLDSLTDSLVQSFNSSPTPL